jgi:hypothetical protein
MTFLRSSDPGRGRDAERVAVALRRELLLPVDDELAARHLEAMSLEFDWELAPEPGDPRPKHRAPNVVATCVVAVALSLTSGFAAAGALPATAQHWLSRATRLVGIPLPDAPERPRPPLPPRTGMPRPAPSRTVATLTEPVRRNATAKMSSPAGPGSAAGQSLGSSAALQVHTPQANASWSEPAAPSWPKETVDAGNGTGDNGGNAADDSAANGAEHGARKSEVKGSAEDKSNGEQSAGESGNAKTNPEATAGPTSNQQNNDKSNMQSDGRAAAADVGRG